MVSGRALGRTTLQHLGVTRKNRRCPALRGFRLEACIQPVSSIFSGACMAWARLLLLIFGCFFAHSKGDVRQFFRLLFCIWTRF